MLGKIALSGSSTWPLLFKANFQTATPQKTSPSAETKSAIRKFIDAGPPLDPNETIIALRDKKSGYSVVTAIHDDRSMQVIYDEKQDTVLNPADARVKNLFLYWQAKLTVERHRNKTAKAACEQCKAFANDDIYLPFCDYVREKHSTRPWNENDFIRAWNKAGREATATLHKSDGEFEYYEGPLADFKK